MALLVLLPEVAGAAIVSWDGGPSGTGTDWNTADNWAGDVLPGTADTAQFSAAGLPTSTVISLGASQTISEIRIPSYSGVNAFTIGSAADITAGYTLTLTNVYRADNNGNTQTIAANAVLAGDSLWNMLAASGGISVTGSIGSASPVTFTKDGTSNNLTLSGSNTFTGGLRALGGTLTLNGTNAYTGSTVASGGNLTLAFGAATATNIINSSSALELGGTRGGGSLTVNGRNLASVVNSQAFNGLTLNSGASSANIVNGIASGKTLVSFGAITRNAGSTINFTQPTVNTTISAQNGFTSTTSNDATGILGAYATVGGTDWASNNGTNIVAYTGYTVLSGATPNILDGVNTNVRISSTSTGDVGQAAGTVTINTLNANDATARVVTVGTGNILRLGAVGGILSTGTGGLTIGASGNAGSLTAGGADNAAGELIINNSTAMTVNSVIADNGSGAVALTKSGAGTATLTTASTYTGGTTVNAGTLALAAGSTDPLVTTGAITLNGGTFNLGASTSQTTSGAVVIAGGSLSNGTLTKSGANYDLRNGSITTKLAGSVGIDKTTAGTLTFANTVSNTFTGDTTITEGSLVGTSASGILAITGNLIVGSIGGGNPASYSQTNTNFASTKSVTIYSNGTVNAGNGAQNFSGGITIIGGLMTGSYNYVNAPVNMTGGTFALTNLAGSNGTYNINASASTANITGTLANNVIFNVADGAAATDLLFSGTRGGGSTLTKTGLGKMVATGSSAYSGATTITGGILSVSSLANGGSNSAIGSAAVAAANLKLGNNTTFQYTGTGHSTDRLFTINGTLAGDTATLDASGTGAVNFTNAGAIAYGTNTQTRTLILAGTSTADNTLAATIGNNGTAAVSVTKNDAGKWILTGTNTYTGATTVNAGTLVINGSSTSALTIGASGTLGGTGTISAATVISGTHNPGNSPGIQTFGSDLTYSGGSSVVNWELKSNTVTNAANPNALFDTIVVGGNLDFSAATALNLSFVPSGSDVLWADSFWSTSRTGTNGWLVYDVAGTTSNFSNLALNTANWLDSGSNAFNTALPGASFSFYQDANDIYLNYTAVPEPATWGLLAFSLTTVLVLRRRKA